MYIFKNAFKSISRNLGRNILIGIIILVIGLASTVALSINSSAQKIVDQQVGNSEVEVGFEIDRESLKGNVQDRFDKGESMESMDDMVTSLTFEEIENYSNSSYVKELYVTKTISLDALEIASATNDNMFDRNNGEDVGGKRNEMMGEMQGGASQGEFSIVGYNQLNAMTDFISGSYKVTTGEMFNENSEEYECIVNQELIDENELALGDTIVFINPNDEEEIYELVIVGIYEDTTENTDMQSMFSMTANTIMVNMDVVDGVVLTSSEGEYEIKESVSSTIILNSMDDIDSFTAEVTEKGLSDNFTITTNVDSIVSSLEPLENLQNFSSIFFYMVLSIGVVILVILNMINLRERKYEIGVLRAIGMKKQLVCTQFVFEIFVVAIVAISLGIAGGAIASVPVADYMLANEISSMESAQEEVSSNFGMESNRGPSAGRGDASSLSSSQDVSYIENIEATISFEVVLQIFGISILLTIMSSIFSVINIVRFNPLRILRDRS